jgi:hypothetical protein
MAANRMNRLDVYCSDVRRDSLVVVVFLHMYTPFVSSDLDIS